ncbi:AlpA family phage regulatory protein [Bradyrhizobium tropiciagri]|uniref:helix-turn-helix transcriptional regulator n=1 Tax=Bradyrhizobium tropiciagri TaxID=312253 RepID=UPI001BAC6880|nr:AlpA family phage regulatory protein [Bradyrhizobium tropiciagri]MBR0896023.1 AlpA family phage regulatory protein [Bradyrhizobium tropiciagri]
MLSVRQVLAVVPFSRRTLYREMDEGRFPKSREIAPRRIAWYEDDVKDWQKALDRKAAPQGQVCLTCLRAPGYALACFPNADLFCRFQSFLDATFSKIHKREQ